MPWANYHSHTVYCDGEKAPEFYVKEAIRQNLIAYGYSSHAPVPFSCDWTIPGNKIMSYVSDIEKIKQKYEDKIQIYLGLEIDYIPEITGINASNPERLNLDYTIGSIHFVDILPNGERWSFDWTYDFFLKGLQEIFNNDVKKMVRRYYELTKEMLVKNTPDILGHMDKITMYNVKNKFFDPKEKWYLDETEELFRLIKEKDVIVEINTRGLYKNGLSLYPNPAFLKRIKEMNIPISISSDSHKPEEITFGLRQAADILRNEGIDETWILIDRLWKPFPFDSVKGIYV